MKSNEKREIEPTNLYTKKIKTFFPSPAALDTPNVQVKKQVFELLSALCVYSADGYNRAIEALEHYKTFMSERYRFKVVVDELNGAKNGKGGKNDDYRTVLLAFVNCLIISTPALKVRIVFMSFL